MGQLLLVNGCDEAVVKELFNAGLAAFRSLHGTAPAQQDTSPGLAVALFGRTAERAPRAAIHYGADGRRWACAVGALYPPEAVRTLLDPRLALEGGLRSLDGMFAIAVGDPAGRRFAVATDRLGTLHLYRREVRGCVVVSTSSLVLAAVAPTGWDASGCREFLATGSAAEQRTLFSGVTKLPPATVAEYALGRVTSEAVYWEISDVVQGGSRAPGRVSEVVDALRATAATIQRAHADPVYDLTSGYDSRVLVGAALRESALSAVTVAGHDGDRDVVVSRQIAERFGLAHVHCGVDWAPGAWWRNAKRAVALCDGEYDALDYARVIAVHERLSARFDVSVNGAMGEMLRGHWWNQLLPHLGSTTRFDARRVASLRLLTSPAAADLLREDFELTLLDHYAAIVERATARLGGRPNTSRMDVTYLMLRAQRWLGRSTSASNRIWPVVSAWSFRAPLEAALSMPFIARYGNRAVRSTLQALDPALAAMPLENGYPAQPIRPWNLHRYAPFVRDVAWRAQRHLLHKPPLAPPTANAAMVLWRDDEVRDVLDVRRMRTVGLLDDEKLSRMLVASQRDEFRSLAHLGRVVTLELAARGVEAARAAVARRSAEPPERLPQVSAGAA